MEDYAIIILAAGSSDRMGQPKQLLKVNGKTLIRHTVNEALAALPNTVFVVTGANENTVVADLSCCPGIHIIHNPDWQNGMSSSIRTGIAASLAAHPTIQGCLISVCDQPFITSGIFAQLISAHKKNPQSIIASAYQGVSGVPALFDRSYFSLLEELRGKEGAKKILSSLADHVLTVPFPRGNVDLDTPEDYRRYLAEAAN